MTMTLDEAAAFVAEMIELEDIANKDHCEATHQDDPPNTCTHTPVAVKTCQCQPGWTMKVCLAGVLLAQEAMRARMYVCGDCQMPCEVCWDYKAI